MFLIVEFNYHENQQESTITKFNSIFEVVSFIADKSVEHESFKVLHIHEYKHGDLIPYELKLVRGRLHLSPSAKEGKPLGG